MATPNFPEWLTSDFLKTCLESDEENSGGITVTSHTLEQAVAPGNNYGSNMIRANVRYKKHGDSTNEHTVSLVIKAPLPEDSFAAEQLKDNLKQLYHNETKYYYEFISETRKLSKHNVVPKHYKSPNPYCMVLEDLKVSGFEMVDRRKLLDFDHCKLFAEASAKLHGLGIALNNSNPELIKGFYFENDKLDDYMKLFMGNSLTYMATYLEDKPTYKKQFDIIKELSENGIYWTIYKEMLEVCKTKPIQTLTQADPWCTNMMFRYSSGRVKAIKIVDFQCVKLNSPIVELVMFLSISANLEVRQTRLNDVYQIYCDSLNGNLEEFGCSERLSMKALKAEVTLLNPLVLLNLCLLPTVLTDAALDMEEHLSVKSSAEEIKESSVYKTVFHSPHFEMNFPWIFDAHDKHGVFDYVLEKVREIKSRK
uniref:CHK kinase-like domain-containing protein n=1 Tax=Graphocephala atropunctata TaxID=36148 RepID=A0A1B6M8F0_9HEMI